MANETPKQDEGTQTEEQTQDTQEAHDERKSPAFLGIKKQLEERNKAISDLQSQLDAIKKQKEVEALEAAGQWEEAKKMLAMENQTLKEQIANIEKKYQVEREQERLRTELIKAGATHEYFIRGALMDYSMIDGEKPSIDEFVKGLRADKNNAPLFGSVALKSPVADSANAAATSGTAKNLEARLRSDNKAERDAALSEYWTSKLSKGD